jgi:hypothetical protein
MPRLRRWWFLLLLIPILCVGGFVLWAETTPTPMSEAATALEAPANTDDVSVTTQDWLAFHPVDREPSTGLIFYPGARVDPRSYAPPARDIAAEGYLVVVVPMPLNLAFLIPDRASTVIASFPEMTYWAVGGHSLGGAMAARFAYQHPSEVDGLVLWGAYPGRGDDLSEQNLGVTVIYGTRDGLATPEEILAARPLLPPHTEWVRIEGGNHAQFGWYGPQNGDNPATISRETQQRQVTAATAALLRRVEMNRELEGEQTGHQFHDQGPVVATTLRDPVESLP